MIGDKKAAEDVASKIQARLALGEFDIDIEKGKKITKKLSVNKYPKWSIYCPNCCYVIELKKLNMEELKSAIRHRTYREKLTDSYVKSNIMARYNLKRSEITPEMIIGQKLILKLKRRISDETGHLPRF